MISILSGCQRVLQRWVLGCVGGVVAGLYRVRCAQRDGLAVERMRGLNEVRFEQFGLSEELLLKGMKRSLQQQEERVEDSTEATAEIVRMLSYWMSTPPDPARGRR